MNEQRKCAQYSIYTILFRHKKNKILSFVVTWMELGVNIVSEISQAQNDEYHIFLVIYGG